MGIDSLKASTNGYATPFLGGLQNNGGGLASAIRGRDVDNIGSKLASGNISDPSAQSAQ